MAQDLLRIYELWHEDKPDLLTTPMKPFRSAAKAHDPLKNLDIHSERSILNYAVGAALPHKGAKEGLILFNPLTKRDVI